MDHSRKTKSSLALHHISKTMVGNISLRLTIESNKFVAGEVINCGNCSPHGNGSWLRGSGSNILVIMGHDVTLQVAVIGKLLSTPTNIAGKGLLPGMRLQVNLQVGTGDKAPLTFWVLASERTFTWGRVWVSFLY
eukprot:sb/3474746/